ncbi:amidohydrolase [bacterium]|nr:amidohydrolase [bacterium]
MKKTPKNIIDFHVHLFPDKLFDAIWEYFGSVYKWNVIHKFYYKECVEHLNVRNVSHIIYSNYAHKPGVAEALNRWNKEILDEIPNLYCFAAFHPGDEKALDVARDILDHPKVLGFKLQLLVQDFYPHDERLFPLYELMIDRNKRILFHAGTGPTGNQYVGYQQFIKVLKRYPQLHANVAHMGGLEYQEFIDLLPQYPNLYLDTSFSFHKSMGSGFNLDPQFLEQNREQLVYGSDFPNLIFPREEEIEVLLDYNLSDEFYRKLFFENGMRLINQHTNQ